MADPDGTKVARDCGRSRKCCRPRRPLGELMGMGTPGKKLPKDGLAKLLGNRRSYRRSWRTRADQFPVRLRAFGTWAIVFIAYPSAHLFKVRRRRLDREISIKQVGQQNSHY